MSKHCRSVRSGCDVECLECTCECSWCFDATEREIQMAKNTTVTVTRKPFGQTFQQAMESKPTPAAAILNPSSQTAEAKAAMKNAAKFGKKKPAKKVVVVSAPVVESLPVVEPAF